MVICKHCNDTGEEIMGGRCEYCNPRRVYNFNPVTKEVTERFKNKDEEMIECPKCCGTGGLCNHEGYNPAYPDECPIFHHDSDCYNCDFGEECPDCEGEGIVVKKE